MNESFAERLLNTGILQFGYFVVGDKSAPVRFCPEYLPAYPQLLTEIGKLSTSKFYTSNVDHLITTADSLPLGLAASLQSGLSLVYSRGREEAVVYDLVGSYNSGHQCVLLLNTVSDVEAIRKFISGAQSVGLEIQSTVTLFEMRPIGQRADIPVHPILRLVEVVSELVGKGRLSEGQAQAVASWIQEV